MPTKSPKRDLSQSTTQATSSPYRSMLPANADIEEDPLRLRLDFHGESVILHDFDRGLTRTRLVSALDIAQLRFGGVKELHFEELLAVSC